MVQTGDSRQSSSRGGGVQGSVREQNMLSGVEPSKRQKFQSKLEEFEKKRNWTRDSYKEDLAELNNTIETVEELITDLQAEINRREGNGESQQSKKKEIINEYGQSKLDNLHNLGGRYSPDLLELRKNEERLKELYQRIASWMAYRERLQEIAKDKLGRLTNGYKEEFVDSEVANRLLDWQEARQEKFEEDIDDKIDSKISNKFARHDEKIKHLEENVDEAKSEARTHRRMLQETIRTLSESDNDHDELVERLKKELEAHKPSFVEEEKEEEKNERSEGGRQQRQEDSIETSSQPETSDQSQEDDYSDIDEEIENIIVDEDEEEDSEDKMEAVEQEEEEEEQRVYELKGKDLEERYKELQEMTENHNFEGMSNSAISEYVDVSRPYLFQKILPRVQEEYGTDLGLLDDEE